VTIDAHQHFWRYDPVQYPWIPQGSTLHADRLPADLAPLLERAGIDGTVAVQARQSVEESRWLLGLADESPLIKGVVGWVDLRSPTVERELSELAAHPRFRGVRHVAQDEPDDFLRGDAFQRGIARLADHGLTYDLLIFPRQLPAAIDLVRRFPAQPFVLDHLAKPPIKSGALSPWREGIRELAACPNVLCKVSGMVTEADHTAWQPVDLQPYLDVVLEAFGAKRLMYGSDWPVCLLASDYARQHAVTDDYFKALSAAERDAIMGANAIRFYGLKP
jgi:L-fuconolactonase